MPSTTRRATSRWRSTSSTAPAPGMVRQEGPRVRRVFHRPLPVQAFSRGGRRSSSARRPPRPPSEAVRRSRRGSGASARHVPAPWSCGPTSATLRPASPSPLRSRPPGKEAAANAWPGGGATRRLWAPALKESSARFAEHLEAVRSSVMPATSMCLPAVSDMSSTRCRIRG